MFRIKNNDRALLGAFTAGLGLILILNRQKIKNASDLNPSNNRAFIETLHPKYKTNFVGFLHDLSNRGYSYQITSAYRPYNKQAQLKKANKKNAAAGFSHHNYGLSSDIVFKKGGIVLDKDTPKKTWLNSIVPTLAKKYGLEWGGNFTNYYDPVHFYVPLDTTKLYAQALKQFGRPELIQGNKLVI